MTSSGAVGMPSRVSLRGVVRARLRAACWRGTRPRRPSARSAAIVSAAPGMSAGNRPVEIDTVAVGGSKSHRRRLARTPDHGSAAAATQSTRCDARRDHRVRAPEGGVPFDQQRRDRALGEVGEGRRHHAEERRCPRRATASATPPANDGATPCGARALGLAHVHVDDHAQVVVGRDGRVQRRRSPRARCSPPCTAAPNR